MMHPSSRFALTLVLSLALWYPTLRATLQGGVEPIDASLHWVGGFLVASFGVRLIGGLLDAYAAPVEAATVDAADAGD